jgi:hypothetical protein
MRLLQACLLPVGASVLALLILRPTPASGQCPYRDAVTGYVLATYDGTAMQVRLDLENGLWWPGTNRGNAVGFDIFRKQLGYECGPQVRVTAEPIAWPTECEVFEATLTDPDVALDTAYEYEARPVDAGRNPAQGEGVYSIQSYGVAGTALLAHGHLTQGDNFMMFVDSCPSECLAGGLLWPDGSEPFDPTRPVLVYGNRVGVTHYSNGWATTLFATSVRNAPCLVAVESVEWGTVKRLYD